MTLLPEFVSVKDLADEGGVPFFRLGEGDPRRQKLSSHVNASSADPDAVALRRLVVPERQAPSRVLSAMYLDTWASELRFPARVSI